MKIFTVIFLFFCSQISHSQILFSQETLNGGISVDGKNYSGTDCLQADSIVFTNIVPIGSIIKKAFLLSNRYIYYVGSKVFKDTRHKLNFNNNIIEIDSSNIVTSKFNSNSSNPCVELWIVSKDVTAFVQANNNTLITPCQTCLMSGDTSRKYVLSDYVLMIVYENTSMPNTNSLVYLNNKTYSSSISYDLNNMNPINTLNSVGLSIWNSYTGTPNNCNYTLNSTLGNFNLGTLDMYLGNNIYSNQLFGSFNYHNNTLIGLEDDTPDNFIDSTDALANISTYIANNTNGFTLSTTGNVNKFGTNQRLGFFLAYTTPCPTSTSKDTSITICRGLSQQLNASAGFTNYNWYPLAGLNDSTIANPIASPLQSTNYIAYVKDAAGCMHTEHTQIIVHGAPKPDTITTTNAVCGTKLGTLTITPNYHNYAYTYNIGNGATTVTNITNILPGTYTLTTTDYAGCTYQNIFSISEVNPVTANFSIQTATSNYIAPLYVSFSNNTTGATNYTWYFPTTIATTYNTNYTFNDAGTYTVTLIAYNNLQQCADTATQTIIVLPQDTAGIFIPNVFSPNNDNINDLFEVKTKNASIELFEIYDRWGVIVFKSEIKNLTSEIISWAGRTTSGMECNAGTYFYVIKIKLDENYSKVKTKEYKGFITLVR